MYTGDRTSEGMLMWIEHHKEWNILINVIITIREWFQNRASGRHWDFWKSVFGILFNKKATSLNTNEKVAIKKVFQDRRYKNREHIIIQELNHPSVVMLKHSFFT